ncbi:MAG: DUF3038 domain-containing protein [Microcoleus sp. PH2017_25_DOB_D_A]|jgi:hypothetical protein|uniref:DUF3038 domain-containing protein n=1 Tax=unclassified Microcoleus TaxID=2642155 RepID=UPI001DB6B43C|nr:MULTISPECIES: DUF3038 domain-containing protein [unclassified Microcoleus]MCC3431974.1 DUF3038 domain-containing protein [Microcoleus sp. PH2017_04_SCI_O_A]MCC3513507.1 DUF3038 domain-containing protein [Microcoleus sp. PH2017_17_BER_D_A]TAE14135.1 MAG: DUF3038 domain-containing protein [Oscillatoriales cyanobacterium]MCC3474954.1 DUF3038 domain-containing protein [Microcoleus sp. PH2017_13_LAR_U_A]MCC3487435.1 DUF3038 domain-containing protein [Microcoleus sp. PH2017_14_LAR_D_A]
MDVAVILMPSETSLTESNPLILDSLPDLSPNEGGCPRRTRLQIDLMLLAIEALYLGGAEEMLAVSKELELESIVKNRVAFWQMRNTNPLRRYAQRRSLTVVEAKALVAIACNMARKLTATIRQLLLDSQQLRSRNLPLSQNLQLAEYLERFRAHFRSRMNPKRSVVVAYDSDDKLNELALNLLSKLLFCTGTAGMQRFWVSLFDGEIE